MTQIRWFHCREGLFLITVIVFSGSFFEAWLRADEPDRSTLKTPSTERERGNGSQSAKPSTPMKVQRYCRWLMTKYDLNSDGVLQENEWKNLRGQPQLIDKNGDGSIELEELTRWTAEYGIKREIGVARELPRPIPAIPDPRLSGDESTEPSETTPVAPVQAGRRRDSKFFVPDKRLPAGLPDWFLDRDEDGDAQLTLAEFSPTGVASEAAEFARYDLNRDGLMTAKECVGRSSSKSTSTNSPDDVPNSDATPAAPPAAKRKSLKKSK